MSENPDLFESLDEYCLFCDPERHGQGAQIILRSDSLYLFAGLGAIESGYIIIAPYQCESSQGVRALAELSPEQSDELTFLRGLVAAYYRAHYKTIGMSFEHGRAGSCLPIRHGTRHCYHGHLCCYPTSFPLWECEKLRQLVNGEAPHVKRYIGLSELGHNIPYLYIEHSKIDTDLDDDHVDREIWDARAIALGGLGELESQLLRRCFAEYKGEPEWWDWRAFPFVDRSLQLVADFHNWLREPRQAGMYAVDWATACPQLDFQASVSRCNRAGNDRVTPKFEETWGQKLQQGAIGRFLSCFPDNQPRRFKVLDAGCGLGTYANAFAASGIDSYGVDISSPMLAVGRHRGLSSVRWAQMDIFAPCFADRSFDGIWFSAVLVHVPRIRAHKLLRQFARMLNPGGVLYLSAQIGSGSVFRWEGRVFFYYSENELLSIFRQAGFDVIESWKGEVSAGTCGDTRIKRWRHFLLRLANPHALSDDSTALSALGERKIIRQIEAWLESGRQSDRILINAGDDAAAFIVDPQQVVVTTTDHCPTPVLSLLGDSDPWVKGWYSMLISLSDLAAMGARPLGMLLAIEAQRQSTLSELGRFYEGALAASREFECPIIGGNLREGETLHCVSTAFGQADRHRLLRRDAARHGEIVLVLGQMGLFWAAVLARLDKLPVPERYRAEFDNALRKPIPRLAEAAALAAKHLTRCAMDSSDGLVASFQELAVAGKSVDIHIDLGNVPPHPGVAAVADAAYFDVRKLQLAWGDWQLVCTIERSRMPEAIAVLSPLCCPVHQVGWVSDGEGRVWWHEEGKTEVMTGLPNERFASGSYFLHDLRAYATLLRQTPIGQTNSEQEKIS